jgi:hypothetical protein
MMALVELVFDKTVDDHPRPQRRFWFRFSYPQSQLAILLYKDGRAVEVTTILTNEALRADAIAAGGHRSVYQDTDWEVGVLTAAGYTLVPVQADGLPIGG